MFPRFALIQAALAMGLVALAARLPAAGGGEPAADAPPASPADAQRSDGRTAAADKLPWEKTESKRPRPLLRPISGPREFLGKYGIGDSQWAGFFGGQPLSAAEAEVLVRVLDLYPRFGQENVEAWAVRDVSWDQLAAAGEEHRAQILPLTGRVQRVTKIDLPAEVAARYELDHYHQVRMQIDDAPYVAVVYCVDLPAAWKLDTDLDEPASAWPLFLKVGDAGDDPPVLLFAARRLAWHPDRPQVEWKIDHAHVALAKLGVDIGRFQEVGKAEEPGISAAEREPFYQVLAALGDERAAALLAPQRQDLDVGLLLQKPEALQAHVLPVRGMARRVARIDVADVDIRQRFHIDHYYEVDLSLPLTRTISLRADPKKKEGAAVYEHSFPATICVRELPAGLSVGDGLRQSVEADAVFFKIWHYHSAYTASAQLPQPAPLFLARQVRLVKEEPHSRWVSDVLVGTAMVLAIVTFVGIALWFRMSDRSQRRRDALADAKPAEPDFSNLR
jgi:hypothetical protein